MAMKTTKGFTLVEILIVVGVIGLVAAIALPNFFRAKENAIKNTCIANMKQIEGAVQRWAVDTGAAGDATVGTADLVPNYIKAWPVCGTTSYFVPSVDETPTCPNGITTHTL